MSNQFQNAKVVFVGSGKITTALVEGLLFGEPIMPPEHITVIGRNDTQLHSFSEKGCVTTKTYETVQTADIILLTVTPEALGSALRSLYAQGINRRCSDSLLISVVSGSEIADIKRYLEIPTGGITCVRATTNTAVRYRKGLIVLSQDSQALQNQDTSAEAFLGLFGKVLIESDCKNVNHAVLTVGSGHALHAARLEMMVRDLSIPPSEYIRFLTMLKNKIELLDDYTKNLSTIYQKIFSRDMTSLVKDSLASTIDEAIEHFTENQAGTFAEIIARVKTPGGSTEKGLDLIYEKLATSGIEETAKIFRQEDTLVAIIYPMLQKTLQFSEESKHSLLNASINKYEAIH